MTISRTAQNRALKLSAAGLYAGICALAACSSDPASPTTPIITAGAAGALTAGAPGAGAPGAGAPSAGATSEAGASAVAGGGSGGDTAGAVNGGGGSAGAFMQPNYVTVTFSVDNILWVSETASGGAGGAGGAAAGAGGAAAGAGGAAAGAGGAAAGAGGGAVGPYCAQPGAKYATLPYVATKSFIPSDYQPNGGGGQISNKMGGCTHYDASCGTGNANDGVCGLCMEYTYTPDKVSATFAGVGFVRKWDSSITAPQICMPTAATKVTFYAKGAVGGEKVTFTAQGAAEVPLTLTNAWTKYSIPLAPGFNTETGVEQGFYWKVEPYVAP